MDPHTGKKNVCQYGETVYVEKILRKQKYHRLSDISVALKFNILFKFQIKKHLTETNE